MWNSVKPRDLKLDQYACASPPDVSGVGLGDIDPVAMKCYEGEWPYSRCKSEGEGELKFKTGTVKKQ